MWDFVAKLFDTSDFPARWNCGNWSAAHGWTHIISDLAIFSAYMAIPCALAYFVIRRRDVPFSPIFWFFVTFILSCGIGHLVEASIFWQPWYRFDAMVKICTAVTSWITVLAILPILPKALALPGLASMNRQLLDSNRQLQRHSDALTGREERVIELKREVNTLLSELQREPKYLRGLAGSLEK